MIETKNYLSTIIDNRLLLQILSDNGSSGNDNLQKMAFCSPEVSVMNIKPLLCVSNCQMINILKIHIDSNSSLLDIRMQVAEKYALWEKKECFLLLLSFSSSISYLCMCKFDYYTDCHRDAKVGAYFIAKVPENVQIIMYEPIFNEPTFPTFYFGIQVFDNSIQASNICKSLADGSVHFTEKQTESIIDYTDDNVKLTMNGIFDSLKSSGANEQIIDRSSHIGNNQHQSLLLIGESGSGTFSIAKDLCSSAELCFIIVGPHTSLSRGLDKRFNGIRSINEAFACSAVIRRHRPCVIIFDDLHCLCPNVAASIDPSDGMTSSQALLSKLQRSDRLCPQLVIMCCYNTSLLDPLIVSQATEKIYLSNPGPSHRRQILKRILQDYPDVPSLDFNTLVDSCNKLSMQPLISFIVSAKRIIDSHRRLGGPQPIINDSNTSDRQANSNNDKSDHPVQSSVRKLKFEGVIGLNDVKEIIEEVIVWPRVYPSLFHSFRLSTERGILLYGPPGTGKTFIPRCLANELNCTFLNVRLTDVVRGEVGTGEYVLIQLFHEAKQSCPSLIFIDEFQAIFTDRSDGQYDNQVGQTLSATLSGCLDDINDWNRNLGGYDSTVILIASTNEPWSIDRSFLRPGRFDRKIFVGPLTGSDRVFYVKCELRKLLITIETLLQENNLCSEIWIGLKTLLNDDWIEERSIQIADKCDRFTGADLKLLFKRITNRLVRNLSYQSVSVNTVDASTVFVSVMEAIKEISIAMRSSVSEHELSEYQSWK